MGSKECVVILHKTNAKIDSVQAGGGSIDIRVKTATQWE